MPHFIELKRTRNTSNNYTIYKHLVSKGCHLMMASLSLQPRQHQGAMPPQWYLVLQYGNASSSAIAARCLSACTIVHSQECQMSANILLERKGWRWTFEWFSPSALPSEALWRAFRSAAGSTLARPHPSSLLHCWGWPSQTSINQTFDFGNVV